MNKKKAYIDEFGTNELEDSKENVSTHFILSAVIVDNDKEEDVEKGIHLIQNKYFQGSTIKSSKIKNKHLKRRLTILEEIANLDINIYAVVTNKRLIYGKGLEFKPTFYKYFNGLIDSDLYNFYSDLEIIADEIGSEEFMGELIKYVNQNRQQKKLFFNPIIRFNDDKDNEFIQIADFISGSLARAFDFSKIIDNPHRILEILEKRILYIREWPDTYIPYIKHTKTEDDVVDEKIYHFSIRIASNFIKENINSRNPRIKNQVNVLSYLLLKFRVNPRGYTYADELINKINFGLDKPLSKQLFQSDIIGNLRDSRILIVSGSNGYKLPASKNDLITFFNHYNHIIQPMISRIEKCNYLVNIATDKSLNILEEVEFGSLKKVVNSLKNEYNK